jgi:hypothetical protein
VVVRDDEQIVADGEPPDDEVPGPPLR